MSGPPEWPAHGWDMLPRPGSQTSHPLLTCQRQCRVLCTQPLFSPIPLVLNPVLCRCPPHVTRGRGVPGAHRAPLVGAVGPGQVCDLRDAGEREGPTLQAARRRCPSLFPRPGGGWSLSHRQGAFTLPTRGLQHLATGWIVSPQKPSVEALTSGTSDVAEFGHKAFKR